MGLAVYPACFPASGSDNLEFTEGVQVKRTPTFTPASRDIHE
jgi:hypothetical protein